MTVTRALQQPCTGGGGPVVPTTPLVAFLERVQETALDTFGESEKNLDPKLYVDFSLKSNLSTTIGAFDKLPRNENGSVPAPDLQEFIEKWFGGAGDDLVYAEPVDFVPEPEGFLPKVVNPEVRAWALEVHSLWKNLTRKVSGSVLDRPDLHTLLPLPEPVVIPGSRFREVYYWDSYWIIRGLLASKMHETAKSIVINLISLVETYGYVLNGARAYYTNRSEPPLLSAMVHAIYNRTGDMELVKKALPALLKEYQFWNSGIHKVTIEDGEANNHILSRYYAKWNKPRPESSTIDRAHASKFSSDSEKEQLYRKVASTAESGWDFSTRWMRNISDFTTLSTTSILPVDLNVFLLGMELDIAFLAKVVGDNATSKSFLVASTARKQAINTVFWNEEKGQWLDYWINNGTTCEESHTWQAWNQNHNVYASNYAPLWIDLFNSDISLVEKVRQSLQSSGLVCAAGVSTSTINSGEQWLVKVQVTLACFVISTVHNRFSRIRTTRDFPNGWAPLQHMIVEGLVRSGSQEARSMAQDIAVRWIRTNYVAYKETGAMHEKYNVEKCGASGGGGEYKSQTGFGWSNGVVLAFLEEFGWPKDLKIDCQ
ncbi:hypothetical protein QYF36_026087 [Acer negundo]|nr:hypothetical protein QYF36_026087 [Acer negundo]